MRLFAVIALVPAVLALKDNTMYITDVYPNGTVVSFEAANPGVAVETLHEGPLVEAYRRAFAEEAKAKAKPRGLSKRYVSCWGTALDHSGTDSAVEGWKSSLGGGPWNGCSTSNVRRSWSATSEGVRVYYCLNQYNYCGMTYPSSPEQVNLETNHG